MTPFYFGPDGRRLFAIFQRAHGSGPARAAALLCNPWGEEALRTHRLYRVLADRLARAGLDVMRFDYYGTGDSAGEDAHGELAGWESDIAAAHDEVVTQSGSTRIVWMGARLGAAIASRAAGHAGRKPDRLILWEPVMDGARYLAELAAHHARTLDLSYAGTQHSWRTAAEAAPSAQAVECVGFEIGDRLRHELATLTPESVPVPRTRQCDILDRAGSPEVASLIERWRRAGLRVNTVAPSRDFDWTSPEAFDSALVPDDAVRLLAASIGAS